MQNRQFLNNVISDFLAPDSWIRKKDHWYLVTNDLILVVSLQKSRWGGQFGITLGVFIRPDAQDESVRLQLDFIAWRTYINQYYDFMRDYHNGKYPKENHCDLRVTLDRLVPDKDHLVSALDLERSSMSANERAQTIVNCLREYAVPLFREIKTLKALRELYQRGRLPMLPWIIPDKIKRFLKEVQA